MALHHDPSTGIFTITGTSWTYLFRVNHLGRLEHLGWGPALECWDGAQAPRPVGRAFSPDPSPGDQNPSMDTMAQEFPTAHGGDFRSPALALLHHDGARQADLAYDGHRMVKGKPALAGLPASYAQDGDGVETLELDLRDHPSGLVLTLSWTVFPSHDILCRSVRITNTGTHPVELSTVMSLSLDLPDRAWDLISLPGSWARERHAERRPLSRAVQSFGSRRGASSHQHNPFLALARPWTTEDQGEALGALLVYSGNFAAQAEVDQFDSTRIQMGINPEGFSWELGPGASFQAPEVILTRTDHGLGAMSRIFHRFLRERVARGPWRDKERPILINNWEATYFDFTEDRLDRLADEAARAGIELFVLDDGWFGHRDNDKSSLGDWFTYQSKLPGGLRNLGERMNAKGLAFGLWFEPEMVSPDSELFRAHPDWVLGTPGRTLSLGRNQYVLDLGRPDVQDHLIATLSSALRSAPIAYVKWDMNRHQTEAWSAMVPPKRQGETQHRYQLGLYRVLESIVSTFPDILFESCSGGGGRFDAALLHYMPQAWTSDNTDAITRLDIQCGTSLAYPPSSMGAHVSAVPNHQVGRLTPLATRYHVARTGAFGYELDLCALGQEEWEAIAAQVVEYKATRRLLQFGDYYRLVSPGLVPDRPGVGPGQGSFHAWMSVAPDRSEALVTAVQAFGTANAPQRILRLAGLDPSLRYRIEGMDGSFLGRELMAWGLRLPDLWGDYRSLSLHLRTAHPTT